MKENQSFYFVEVTDTFGGEANYCWARRYKVKATSPLGAVIKVSRDSGYQGRVHKVADFGDMQRHDIRGACICMFTQWWDDDRDSRMSNIINL